MGILGHTGNDDLETFLKNKTYMVKHSEYSHAGERRPGRAFKIVLRATLTEREDFYQVPSVSQTAESIGGLWTVFSITTTLVFMCMLKLSTKARDYWPRVIRGMQA